MATIGFIGLGNMGGPMAANLVKAGHSVRGFDLVPAAHDAARAAGATVVATAAATAEGADVVITMLPAGQQVRDVYGDPAGPLATAKRANCSSTARPSTSRPRARPTRRRRRPAWRRSMRRSPAASAGPLPAR